ncbi:hypothetical protein [Paenibacillus tepidiphilus]|uniref:hypothetical protein n=1 Tax=Paenibacillus tepidiphilus TaxID=2608683 RepID=UPI00123C09C7|nr:hypothetical protein [Paenibacillus tepidiphilus]
MNQELLPDLVLSGVNTAEGGRYNEVRLEGVCKINGPVQARVFRADGMMKLNDDVQAQELDADGKLTFKGNLESGSLTMDGMMTIHGALRCGKLALNGMADIKEDCDLQVLSGEGAFAVGGLLSAGEIDFMLHGKCKAERIGARSIVICRSRRAVHNKLLADLIPKFKAGLKADLIEGEHIELEYTEAELVTGGSVTIGPGCDIDLVEYRDTLKVHPEARIGRSEQIDG